MKYRGPAKLFSGLLGLILISALCAGFLVGRSVRMQQEGKLPSKQVVSEQVASPDHLIQRGAAIIRKALLR